MRFNAMLLGTIALIAMISRPGAAEETATVTLPPQQINPNGDTLEEALQNFAHRLETAAADHDKRATPAP